MGDIERIKGGTPSTLEPVFPRDPLARLVRQHASVRGRVFGAEYTSPWPREDATGR